MTEVAAPVFKKRANKAANIRKRAPTPPPVEKSDSDESDYTDDEGGIHVKRRKIQGVSLSNNGPRSAQDLSKSTVYAADRSTTIAVNEDATKESNWYTDSALVALEGGNKKGDKSKVSTATQEANGMYQGSSSYSTFIEKNPDGPGRHVGPVKAPTNVRAITVTDFAPDVCKDYKQTGYCGFGDSCKFLHAREDYKQGWQLDKEWEKVGAKGKGKQDGKGAESSDLDPEEKMLLEIPFACVICKETYKNPVVTKCGHYFCQKCAMGRYQKEKKRTCAACGVDTGGSFAIARKLKDLLEKKRKRVQEKKERARAAGEQISNDDDDDDDDDSDG
jgi:RING finger protein 113A